MVIPLGEGNYAPGGKTPNVLVRELMRKWGFTIAADDFEITYGERQLKAWRKYPESFDKYPKVFRFRRNESGEKI